MKRSEAGKYAGLPRYSPIHSQEMVQFMWKYSMHMQSTQVPFSVAFEDELDFGLLGRAVNIEIQRNDCLRLRFEGTKKHLKEYFLPEYHFDKLPFRAFSTKEEQDRYFDADASRKLNVFKGETYRIVLFRAYDGKCGVYINASHMIMDAMAAFAFIKDLMAVYDSLKDNSPMPKALSSYEEIIKSEHADPTLEEKISREGKILADFVKKDRPPLYCAINGTKLLERERRLRFNKELTAPSVYLPIFDSTHLTKLFLTPEQSAALDEFIKTEGLSPEMIVQAALRICLSKLNNDVDDTVFWVLCPCRRTVKEKRCGGTLASPMPFREILPSELTFKEAVLNLSSTQAFLFRHSSVPFTVIRKNELDLFGYTMMQSCNSMMFSYLPVTESSFGGRKFSCGFYNMGYYVIPLYTIVIRDPSDGLFKFSYIHRPNMFKDAEVERFHDMTVRLLMNALRDPDATIRELKSSI